MMTREERRKQSRPSRHIFRRLLIFFLFVFILVILGGVSVFSYYVSTAPQMNKNAMVSDNSTKVYDSSNHLIANLNSQNRKYVKYKDIPPTLTNGLTSIEDRHFFTNHGIDPVRIGEAEVADLHDKNEAQGGSTITQQLVKLSVFSTKAQDRTLKRKAQEAWLALKLTHEYPKSKILEYYVNKVYMGHNTYGMRTASQYYYGRPLNRLTLSQTAMLAGMPQSPSVYDPYANNGLATKRRNQVLKAMANNHKITHQQARQAEQVSVKQGLATSHDLDPKNQRMIRINADYLKQVSNELVARHYNLHSGLKVRTNLNEQDQKKMYELANGSRPGWTSPKQQVGASLVDSRTGKVKAVIGGRNETTLFGLNRANQTSRSNGSTNKPLMDYAPAIEYLGYQPGTTVEDTPFYYAGTHIKLWDYDHRYKGPMTMQNALVQSRNVPAIRTLQHVGVQRARGFLDKIGLPTDPRTTSLQNGIGGYFSPIQESAAYASFADGGVYHQPLEINKVTQNNGQSQTIRPKSNQAMSIETASEINNILKGVPLSEDGKHAKVDGLHEAGKTGTTEFPSSYPYKLPSYAVMDSWYAGYTPNLSLTVWTGYDHPMTPGHYLNVKEINIAQRYYRDTMAYASRNLGNPDF